MCKIAPVPWEIFFLQELPLIETNCKGTPIPPKSPILKVTFLLESAELMSSCIMLKNDQTYFKNLAAFTLQDFKRIIGHF